MVRPSRRSENRAVCIRCRAVCAAGGAAARLLDPGIEPAPARPANVILGGLEACFGADAMMPFCSESFPAALAVARREAFRQSRRSCVLLDTVQACLYVLTEEGARPTPTTQRSHRSSPRQSARSPMVVPNEVIVAASCQDGNRQATRYWYCR